MSGDACFGGRGRICDADGMTMKAVVMGQQATKVPIMAALRFLPDDIMISGCKQSAAYVRGGS